MKDALESVVPYHHHDYGAIELKRMRVWAMVVGMLMSTGLVMMTIGALRTLTTTTVSPKPNIGIIFLHDMPLPPPIGTQESPIVPRVPSTAGLAGTKGLPIPVPDWIVDPGQSIASQDDYRSESPADAFGEPGEIVWTPSEGRVDTPPKDWTPYEREPVVVKRVRPEYPPLALRAELEGNVHVKVWVDKEGRVRRAVVLKSDGEIFNEAALAAAGKWRFTPAIMNDAPIDVWVSIPFRFRLSER